MKLVRFALALVLLGSLSGLAYVAQRIEGAGAAQVQAAQSFLSTLTPEQKKRAAFAFDDKERFNWNFVPMQTADRKSTRKGLPLEGMSADQKKKALELLKAGTSATGGEAAVAIMSLEAILRDQEKKGAMVRNPEWYFFTIFGEPGKSGSWGWRVEGHHLSINVTLDGTQVVAATPFFMGANPAQIKSGPREGTKILAPAQELAAKLFDSLDEEQKKVALQPKSFPEPAQRSKNPPVGAPVGLVAAKMKDGQKQVLTQLIDHYLGRMPKDVADRELKSLQDAGVDKIHFAYTGSSQAGKGRSYRVQGPTFVVEFLNEQADSGGNPANHIHSAWRRIKGDFGVN